MTKRQLAALVCINTCAAVLLTSCVIERKVDTPDIPEDDRPVILYCDDTPP